MGRAQSANQPDEGSQANGKNDLRGEHAANRECCVVESTESQGDPFQGQEDDNRNRRQSLLSRRSRQPTFPVPHYFQCRISSRHSPGGGVILDLFEEVYRYAFGPSHPPFGAEQ